LKSGSLNLLESSRPVQTFNGNALPSIFLPAGNKEYLDRAAMKGNYLAMCEIKI
jgi:hypothetical protein